MKDGILHTATTGGPTPFGGCQRAQRLHAKQIIAGGTRVEFEGLRVPQSHARTTNVADWRRQHGLGPIHVASWLGCGVPRHARPDCDTKGLHPHCPRSCD